MDTLFYSSMKASCKLAEVQVQQKLPDHKLIQDVKTRCNSTFYMLERMIGQHDAVTTMLCALCLLGKTELCLSPEDLRTLESLFCY